MAIPVSLSPYAAAVSVAVTALVMCVGTAGAQQPQSTNLSFEAALKQTCPAKNLEFLKPDVLAQTTDAFVESLPDDRRNKVTALAKPGVEACAGSADESCRTAALLGSLRYAGLSAPLAQRFCALPLSCRDWFDCSTEVAAAEAPPAAEPPPVAEPPPAPEPPAVPLPQRRPEREAAVEDEQVETASPPPPEDNIAVAPSSARDAVEGFYRALGRGDGIDAAHYLIPEKRGRGPFSAAAMGRFYGSLRRPLALRTVDEIGPNTVRVRYSFAARDGSVCDGNSIVALRRTRSGVLIESIRALSGC